MALIEQAAPNWPGHERHSITVWDDHAQQVQMRNCETCKVTDRVTHESLERDREREHPGLSPEAARLHKQIEEWAPWR